jgi:hypothetical protein
MRPKALEDAAALSMVTDGGMAHSSDAAKGEEQGTNNMRREGDVDSLHDSYRGVQRALFLRLIQ